MSRVDRRHRSLAHTLQSEEVACSRDFGGAGKHRADDRFAVDQGGPDGRDQARINRAMREHRMETKISYLWLFFWYLDV